jgi:hypothetical protein
MGDDGPGVIGINLFQVHSRLTLSRCIANKL